MDVTGKGKTVVRGGLGMFYDAFSQDMFLGHLPWNSRVLRPGPAYNQIRREGSGDRQPSVDRSAGGKPTRVLTDTGPEGDFFRSIRNIRTPYIQNFNLNVQQQLGSRMVLQVGYVGSKGTRLFQFLDINQPSQAQITAADLGRNCIKRCAAMAFRELSRSQPFI